MPTKINNSLQVALTVIDLTGSDSIDTNNRQLLTSIGDRVITWDSSQLLDLTAVTSIDWENRTLSTDVGQTSLDWLQYRLFNGVNAPVIDWLNSSLMGNWAFDSLINSYNNIATVGNGIPAIYATADPVNQAVAIAATTIFTPITSGLYRLTFELQVVTAATTSSILGGATGVVITFTNAGTGNVAQSITVALQTQAGVISTVNAGNTTTTNLTGQLIINAKAGVDIKYAIGYTSIGVTAMRYDAHIKVEAL